jgi:hypothetical protein
MKGGSRYRNGLRAIVDHVDLRVADALARELSVRFFSARLKQSVERLLGESPERTIVLDDEKVGADRHAPILARRGDESWSRLRDAAEHLRRGGARPGVE